MIRLTDVSKVYHKNGREVRALAAINLEVAAGEFVAVRGVSGSGKTTLLLTVGGMVRPTTGQVMLDGVDLYSLSPPQRAQLRAGRIGFVFQMFHLLGYLNVLENVLSARLAGGAGARSDAVELLDRVGLSDRLNHRPAELSTGERQRVAIARAMLNRPAVILADEPTGNLDPDSATVVMDHLAEFHRDGATILLVTHEHLAEQYAQRTVQMADA